MALLGKSRFSGKVTLNLTQANNPILEIPYGASFPGSLEIRNIHATAAVYLKTVNSKTERVSSSNYGIELRAGESWSPYSLPGACFIVGIASADGVVITVEANWADQL